MLKLLGERSEGPQRLPRARSDGRRPLGLRNQQVVTAALDQDPVGTCMVAARLHDHGIAPRSLGGELWSNDDPRTSLCFSGANLIPLLGGPADVAEFADRAAAAPRACSSLVGRGELVLPMWDRLTAQWGPAREIRADQPLMTLSREPKVVADPRVRRVQADDIDAYLPAAIAMFLGEVGVDPCAGDGGRSYRRRIANLIASGRAFALIDRGQVLFKAEIGAMSRRVGQIQGVWVAPEFRGQGLGATGTAAVAEEIVSLGRTPSLYVNSFNAAARAAYHAVGFTEVGSFATVLVD